VLGAFNARGFVDQDSKRFASAIKAIGKQAFVGFAQRVVGIVKLGSLGHSEFIISVSLRPGQAIAGGVPPAAWQGPESKNGQNRIQKQFSASLASLVREITERMLHYPCTFDGGRLIERLGGVRFTWGWMSLVSGEAREKYLSALRFSRSGRCRAVDEVRTRLSKLPVCDLFVTAMKTASADQCRKWLKGTHP
jgi:hypothetical protein